MSTRNTLAATPYGRGFFDSIRESSESSAREVVPLVVRWLHPTSVVDVGCGCGVWLRAFQESGVDDVFGVDGSYVSPDALLIPAGKFAPWDLKKPVVLPRSFDLVTSLEVAEHLPPSAAHTFVESLTRLGPRVLFSAAIPGQGGTDHLNEQWPDYWAKLFGAFGFHPVDKLRQALWHNSKVAWWYAQNILLFAREVESVPTPPQNFGADANGGPLALVHPGMLHQKEVTITAQAKPPLRRVLTRLPVALWDAAARRIPLLGKPTN